MSGVKDFGAFVTLDGVVGRQDGLVHVSAMSTERVAHPSDVVRRGDLVKVKVVSLQNNRIGLSMKEVDQHTGRDLVPAAARTAPPPPTNRPRWPSGSA